jgi:hypothetical protein
MLRDLKSLVRPERPPGDRVLTVILTSVFAAVVAADAIEGLGERDALLRGFGVVRAVVAAGLLGLLVRELSGQVRRPADRWTGSDTTNTAVLGGLAVLLAAAATFGSRPAYERLTGAVVAVLYAALAVAFAVARRRALR